MNRNTRISAPAPQPSKEEILEALAQMTLSELVEFDRKIYEILQRKRHEKINERGGDWW